MTDQNNQVPAIKENGTFRELIDFAIRINQDGKEEKVAVIGSRAKAGSSKKFSNVEILSLDQLQGRVDAHEVDAVSGDQKKAKHAQSAISFYNGIYSALSDVDQGSIKGPKIKTAKDYDVSGLQKDFKDTSSKTPSRAALFRIPIETGSLLDLDPNAGPAVTPAPIFLGLARHAQPGRTTHNEPVAVIKEATHDGSMKNFFYTQEEAAEQVRSYSMILQALGPQGDIRHVVPQQAGLETFRKAFEGLNKIDTSAELAALPSIENAEDFKLPKMKAKAAGPKR